MRQIKIWKGTSYATISAQEPHSGKDSGIGDSDNDSDSDISGDGLRKDDHQNSVQNGKSKNQWGRNVHVHVKCST